MLCAASRSGAQQPSAPPSLPDLEQRVQELEALVRQLKEERQPTSLAPVVPGVSEKGNVEEKAPERPAAADGAQGAGAAYGEAISPAKWEGFILRSDDKQHSLRITGQIQADNKTFLDDTDYTDVDSFLVRRARLGIEANVLKVFEFRLLPDFGQASPTIQDAYLNVHYWDGFQVEVGKFKQPFSYEQLIADRFVPTLERSLIDQLVPRRDEGVMIHGQKLLDDRLDYGVSASNGERDGNSDTNDRKDFNARVALRPLNDPERFPVLQRLQFGMAVTTGIEQEALLPSTLITPAGVPWLVFNPSVRANGLRNRYSPEVAYFWGPFGFATQYFRQAQRLSPAFTGPSSGFVIDVPTNGFYVLTTLLLTGEERNSYSALTPLRNFNPYHPCLCTGAWELAGRVSRLQYSGVIFDPGLVNLADPTKYSKGATEMTLGFNWYLNPWVRMQFNWEHSWFDSVVRLGPGAGGLLDHQDSFLTRMQVIF